MITLNHDQSEDHKCINIFSDDVTFEKHIKIIDLQDTFDDLDSHFSDMHSKKSNHDEILVNDEENEPTEIENAPNLNSSPKDTLADNNYQISNENLEIKVDSVHEEVIQLNIADHIDKVSSPEEEILVGDQNECQPPPKHIFKDPAIPPPKKSKTCTKLSISNQTKMTKPCGECCFYCQDKYQFNGVPICFKGKKNGEKDENVDGIIEKNDKSLAKFVPKSVVPNEDILETEDEKNAKHLEKNSRQLPSSCDGTFERGNENTDKNVDQNDKYITEFVLESENNERTLKTKSEDLVKNNFVKVDSNRKSSTNEENLDTTQVTNDQAFETIKNVNYTDQGHKNYHKCQKCGKSFSQKVNMKRHVDTIHNKGHKGYKCDSCGKIFSAKTKLKRHIYTIHEGYKDYICEFCGRTFNQRESLCKHMEAIHDVQKIFKCKKCKNPFYQKASFKEHICSAAEMAQKNNKCDSCGKSFAQSQHLKRHIYTVHEEHKDHNCDSCHKSFSTASNLRNHINQVHNATKDYKCDSCAESFSKARKLKIHIMTAYKGHKVHECESCGKSFTQSGYLKVHFGTVHEGRKNHKCSSCGKSFSQAANLKIHFHRIHEGHKDQFYKCDSCVKSFSTAKQLQNHQSKHDSS